MDVARRLDVLHLDGDAPLGDVEQRARPRVGGDDRVARLVPLERRLLEQRLQRLRAIGRRVRRVRVGGEPRLGARVRVRLALLVAQRARRRVLLARADDRVEGVVDVLRVEDVRLVVRLQLHLDRALLLLEVERLAQHLRHVVEVDHLVLLEAEDLGDEAERRLEDVQRAVRLPLRRREHRARRHARHQLGVRDAKPPAHLEQLLRAQRRRRALGLREAARRLADVGRRLRHLLQPLRHVDRDLLVEGGAQVGVGVEHRREPRLRQLHHRHRLALGDAVRARQRAVEEGHLAERVPRVEQVEHRALPRRVRLVALLDAHAPVEHAVQVVGGDAVADDHAVLRVRDRAPRDEELGPGFVVHGGAPPQILPARDASRPRR